MSKSWLFVILLGFLLVPSIGQADSVTLTPKQFQELDIPAWMYGVVTVVIRDGNDRFAVMHDFQNPNEPVICIASTTADSSHFNQVVADVSLYWYIGVTFRDCPENLSTMGLCREFTWSEPTQAFTDQPTIWKSQIKTFSNGLYCAQFGILEVHIQFPGPLPQWMRACYLPFELQIDEWR